MKKICLIGMVLLISACVSYADEYEQSLYGARINSYGYTAYNSPLRLRGLNYRDFYMLDNYPQDYFDMQLWSGISNISRFAIHGIVQNLAR